jgi:hypothetical protein
MWLKPKIAAKLPQDSGVILLPFDFSSAPEGKSEGAAEIRLLAKPSKVSG